MTVRTLRTEKLDLRVSSSAKRMLEAAASVSNRSLSAFVLESALARADEALADRRAFPLSRAKWNDFLAALDAPPPSPSNAASPYGARLFDAASRANSKAKR